MGELTWYLDACVFVRAQDAGVHVELLAAAAASGSARIAGTVRDELVGGDEAASVAIAVHDPTACFVTNEAGAAFLGLLELDRRVTLAPWWFRTLIDAGHLPPALAQKIVGHDPQRRLPTWWQ